MDEMLADGEGERSPGIAVWWNPERRRFASEPADSEVPEPNAIIDGGTSGDERTAIRALLESRIAARLIDAGDDESSQRVLDRLDALPFPAVPPVFCAQLALLYRRRATAGDPEAVDWAIERIVAELYDLDLSELVDLHRRRASHR